MGSGGEGRWDAKKGHPKNLSGLAGEMTRDGKGMPIHIENEKQFRTTPFLS